jgi:hypothetical protein
MVVKTPDPGPDTDSLGPKMLDTDTANADPQHWVTLHVGTHHTYLTSCDPIVVHG